MAPTVILSVKGSVSHISPVAIRSPGTGKSSDILWMVFTCRLVFLPLRLSRICYPTAHVLSSDLYPGICLRSCLESTRPRMPTPSWLLPPFESLSLKYLQSALRRNTSNHSFASFIRVSAFLRTRSALSSRESVGTEIADWHSTISEQHLLYQIIIH